MVGTHGGNGVVVISYHTTVIGGCATPITPAAVLLQPRFTG
jgi:hypothetical protein